MQSPPLNFVDFTKLDRHQLLMVLKWRNHPAISQNMLNKRVTRKEHLAFVEQLKHRSQKRYWLVYLGREPIGVFNLTNIETDKAEVGLYLSPDKIGQGLGTPFLRAALDFTKQSYPFKKVWLEVFDINGPAIGLYQKLGFVEVGERPHLKGKLKIMELRFNEP